MKQIHLWRQWGPGFRAYLKLIEPREPQFALSTMRITRGSTNGTGT